MSSCNSDLSSTGARMTKHAVETRALDERFLPRCFNLAYIEKILGDGEDMLRPVDICSVAADWVSSKSVAISCLQPNECFKFNQMSFILRYNNVLERGGESGRGRGWQKYSSWG